MDKGGPARSRSAANCTSSSGSRNSREVHDAAIIAGGEPGQRDEVGAVAEESDRAIPEEHIHATAVSGRERNVGPFALPLRGRNAAAWIAAPGARGAIKPLFPTGLLVNLVTNGREGLTAGIHPIRAWLEVV